MYTSLTPVAAEELGGTLRLVRQLRSEFLGDVARKSGLSTGYIQNLELGSRTNAAEETLIRLAKGYGIPEPMMQDLILRARILTALERRGLDPKQRSFVWEGTAVRLEGIGFKPNVDMAAFLALVFNNNGKPVR